MILQHSIVIFTKVELDMQLWYFRGVKMLVLCSNVSFVYMQFATTAKEPLQPYCHLQVLTQAAHILAEYIWSPMMNIIADSMILSQARHDRSW